MKGYPKTRFDIVNNTQTAEITVNPNDDPIALYMQPYTSNKGTEEWELLTDFERYNKEKGGISFIKHGQAQLTVAEALRSGAYVLGKRLVSKDAKLANVTVKARTVSVDESTTYLYLYASSGTDASTFNDAVTSGTTDYTYDKPTSGKYAESETEASYPITHDIPLFTVTPMGRGESTLFFRLNPEYTTARNRDNYSFIKYSFEVIEDQEILESIIVTINPEPIVNGIGQSMNPKIKANSNQVRVKMYDNGVYDLVNVLSKTAVLNETPILPVDLINYDFVNGFTTLGTTPIGGIVTVNNCTADNSDLWKQNIPQDIKDKLCDITVDTGIPLVNGSYGKMGTVPMDNQEEMKAMLLEAFGCLTTGDIMGEDGKFKDDINDIPLKDLETGNFRTSIYDLDAYKIDAIFDCGWDFEVKNAIVNLLDFRGDAVFLSDLTMEGNDTQNSIIGNASQITESNYVSIYHNYFNIIDPFSRKEITVTLPYLLVPRMTSHITNGVGRPFAGISNGLTFPEIISGTVNFYPVEIPGVNQKQDFADHNINYLSMYDGVPVLETMYVNDTKYTQLSYLHNIMGVQEIIKVIRTRCPQTRYTFLDGDDLEKYIDDVTAIITQYSSNFKSIKCEYMKDEKYEQNNIFYAVLTVQFKNFIQEEYFKIIAIN